MTEEELRQQYIEASHRASVLQKASASVPGGYHRCAATEGYPFLFVSKSFEQIVGYTKEQIEQELDNKYINLVLPEDLSRFAQLEASLEEHGNGDVAYRIRRGDGEIRWIQDSTLLIDWDGEPCYQCTIADITDFVRQQEEFAKERAAMEELAARIPCGYHRCTTDGGFLLDFVSDSFLETVGYTREEIEGTPFINLVAEEDQAFFMSHEPELTQNGRVELAYRLRRKDGSIRWIKDTTTRIKHDGKEFYQCILADITPEIENLKAAKKEAEESSLAKSTFLFNASHDIRTPMNAIQGFAHIIDANAEPGTVVKDAVGKMIQASKTLMTLINDVLDLSSIERGKESIDEQPLNMEDHAVRLYEMFASEMERLDIQFEMENDIQHRNVLGDELKLTRIAMNILSNAKKFTPADGKVTFGIKETNYDGETAIYSLYAQDTGIGMSEEFQKRAFEQFERERTSTESGIAGSGLGLAIIKRYCDLMHGTCQIESELGKGTRIIASVPLRIAEEENERAETVYDNRGFQGKHVLIVEDNDFNREIARFVFETAGFVVEEAENGKECLEKLASMDENHFDFILMDVQMPIMDGYTATEEIRKLSDLRVSQIPIVAMTANAFEEDRQKCFAAGMNGHIAKPLEADTVFREIKRVLRV